MKTKKQDNLLTISSICRSGREKEPQHNFLSVLLNIDELLLIEDIITSCYHEVIIIIILISLGHIYMLEPNLSRTVASADVSGDLENHFLPLVNLLMAENEDGMRSRV